MIIVKVASHCLTLWLGVESSDQNSRNAMSPKICHLASSDTLSQRAGGLPLASGNGVPSICIAHGNLIPLACTMYPTKANMATPKSIVAKSFVSIFERSDRTNNNYTMSDLRPCLISA